MNRCRSDKDRADLKEPAILVGHSMGGLVAQIVAARVPARALVLLAPSAPWGTLPTSAWEIASANGLYFAGQFWNKPLRPEAWIAETHALDLLPPGEREATFARFVPESAPESVSSRDPCSCSAWSLGRPAGSGNVPQPGSSLAEGRLADWPSGNALTTRVRGRILRYRRIADSGGR